MKLYEVLKEPDSLADTQKTIREMDKAKLNSRKKQIPISNESSPEFKQLGYLHSQDRNVDYWPQESKLDFRTNHQIHDP